MHEPYYSIHELDFQAHHPCHPSPPDWRDQFIYFLMVDRFDDERDHPRYVPGAAPTGRRRGDANRFQGGTLRGITRRLDYIAGLGCTAIWIMFGGTWGAFDTSGVQFFDPEHPLYVAIRAVGWVRAAQPALRYGRQYFREISGDGEQFGPAIDGDATLAYSRILDAEEILVAMNLAGHPRADYVTVDAALSPPGQVMRDLLHPTRTLFVEHRGGRACVRIELPAWGLVILKTTPPPAHV